MSTRSLVFAPSRFFLLAGALAVFAGLSVGCKGDAGEGGAQTGPSEKSPSETSPSETSPSEKGEKPADPPAPDPALATAMTEHFVHAIQLEQGVIDGDLEAVVAHGNWLVEELPKQALPEAWQPQLTRMQAAAAEAVKAGDQGDLAAAAAATGKLVETCGACHSAIGRGPTFAPPPPVPVGDDAGNRMLRHQWAAQRMREGMIAASDERWRLGAGAVSQAPPEPCPIPDAEVLDAETLKLREKIYELGAKALKTEGADERAAVYGEYLSTCAGCHVGGC